MNQTNQINQINDLRWYALRTRSRYEKLVREQLAKQGIEPLLPTVKRLRQWKDRKKEVEVPLFSGYCFVRFALGQRLPVLKTIGVVDIVGSGHCPEPIADEEIAAIQTLMASVLPYDSHPYLVRGHASGSRSGPAPRGSRDSLAQRKAASISDRGPSDSASGGSGNRCHGYRTGVMEMVRHLLREFDQLRPVSPSMTPHVG